MIKTEGERGRRSRCSSCRDRMSLLGFMAALSLHEDSGVVGVWFMCVSHTYIIIRGSISR